DQETRALGLLVPMHLAHTTAEARARSEAGVMSYFKTIADMRIDYTDWLMRRGDELPTRLKRGAGAMVDFSTVYSRPARCGDWGFGKCSTGAKRPVSKDRRDTLSHLAQHRRRASPPSERVDGTICPRGDAAIVIVATQVMEGSIWKN